MTELRLSIIWRAQLFCRDTHLLLVIRSSRYLERPRESCGLVPARLERSHRGICPSSKVVPSKWVADVCARERERENERTREREWEEGKGRDEKGGGGGRSGGGGGEGDMERKAKGERERRRKDGKRGNVELIFPHARNKDRSTRSKIGLIAVSSELFGVRRSRWVSM